MADATQLQHLYATRNSAAATLAASIIQASGRPHSVAEAMKVHREVYYSLFPEGAHQTFRTEAPRLEAIRR